MASERQTDLLPPLPVFGPEGWSSRGPSLGAKVEAMRMNDFLRQADAYGQPGSDRASSRTDPDDAECLTGIYGSEGWRRGTAATRTVPRCPSRLAASWP